MMGNQLFRVHCVLSTVVVLGWYVKTEEIGRKFTTAEESGQCSRGRSGCVRQILGP